MASGWSEIPEDLLRLIANCLDIFTDQLRFGCVCTSWRSILLTINRSHPWCLLPRDDVDQIHEKFLCLHEKKVHNLEFIPEVLAVGSRFRGCSHSWLVYTNDFSLKIYLYNPFTKVLIALPPWYNFPDVRKYCPPDKYELEIYDNNDGHTKTCFINTIFVHKCLIDKLVLSSTPTKPNCMVAAIYGSRHFNLAYCKLGDERWTSIDKGMMRYDDVIFHDQNLVYAVTFTSHMHIYDLSCNNSPKLVDTIQPPTPQPLPPQQGEPERERRSYLVKTSIGLLLVQRHWIWTGSVEERNYCQQTKIFNLYMYEPSSRSWCKVENIGENVLFLGLNTSVSIPSSCLRGYKGNHIYFTDSLIIYRTPGAQQGSYQISVYDLDSTSVRCLQRYDSEKYWFWPAPIWYIHSIEDFFEH